MSEKTYVYLKDSEELTKYVNQVWKGTKGQRTDHILRDYVELSHRYYYGQAWGNGSLGNGMAGEQHEFATMQINESRSDIKAVVAMTTQNKLAFDAITTSSDVSAQNNVIVANALLEQLFYSDKVEPKCRKTLEGGLVYGTHFMYVGFTTAAQAVGVTEEGRGVYKASLDIQPLHMLDVKIEDNKDEWEDHDYVMFRRLENRYELIALHPEVAEELANAPMPDNIYFPDYSNPEEHPDIWVYYTFHKPCKALPQGRMHKCTDNDIVLFDDANPYECLPVVCYKPSVRFGSSYGHALLWDLLPIQEALNTLDSSNLTIMQNFATPNILASNTFKCTETDIAGGLKLIQGAYDPNAPDGGFPRPMEMPKPDQTYMQIRDQYANSRQLMSGVNAAVRGQTTSQQSGTAIALAQSAAQSYNSSVEAGYVKMVEDVCDLIILVCRKFMTRQEITAIAGLSMEYQTETFTTASLDAITRIRVNLGNALSKTISGRVEIATQLLGQGQINATEYMSILLTGDLPGKVREKSGQDLLISGENELLSQGEAPIINILDNHVQHITRHRTLLDSPLVRRNSNLIALIMQHLEEHITMLIQLQQTNPMLLDLALGNPLGTSGQMTPSVPGMPGPQGAPAQGAPAQGAPAQLPPGQEQPQLDGADTAAMGGVEDVAQKGRDMANQRLTQVGGVPNDELG